MTTHRKRRPRAGDDSARLLVRLVLVCVAALAGCRAAPAPAPSAPASPTPPPLPAATRPAYDPLDSVGGEVRIYLLLVRPVTSDYAILNARDQPVSVLEELLQELDLVEPPPEMIEAHALLKEGYQLLVEGGALLATKPDPVLRSEAIFIQDWGVRQLWEHRRLVAAYLEQAELGVAP